MSKIIETKYHEVQSLAANPDYDRRCKYGQRARKDINVGAIIREVTFEYKDGHQEKELSWLNEPMSRSWFNTLQTQEVEQLSPVRDFALNHRHFQSREFIIHLLQTGAVTIDQIKEFEEREEE
jgi:hypothetical protein